MTNLSTPQKRALVILATCVQGKTPKTVERRALWGTQRIVFSTLRALENRDFIYIGYRQNAKEDVIYVLPTALAWVDANPDCRGLV